MSYCHQQPVFSHFKSMKKSTLAALVVVYDFVDVGGTEPGTGVSVFLGALVDADRSVHDLQVRRLIFVVRR